MKKKHPDILPGTRFGRLTVLGPSPKKDKQGKPYYCFCKCDCGKVTEPGKYNLLKGISNSCGCLHSEIVSLAAGRSSYNRLFEMCRRKALERDYCFELTFEQFMSLVTQNCIFCGQAPRQFNIYARSDGTYKRRLTPLIERSWVKANGIDRLDNKVGYVLSNSAPCCAACNHSKKDHSTEDFISHARRIIAHQDTTKKKAA